MTANTETPTPAPAPTTGSTGETACSHSGIHIAPDFKSCRCRRCGAVGRMSTRENLIEWEDAAPAPATGKNVRRYRHATRNWNYVICIDGEGNGWTEGPDGAVFKLDQRDLPQLAQENLLAGTWIEVDDPSPAPATAAPSPAPGGPARTLADGYYWWRALRTANWQPVRIFTGEWHLIDDAPARYVRFMGIDGVETLGDLFKEFPEQEWGERIEMIAPGGPVCDCPGKAPTYPLFRSNPHLPGCPHYVSDGR